jgi:hypothetical protein
VSFPAQLVRLMRALARLPGMLACFPGVLPVLAAERAHLQRLLPRTTTIFMLSCKRTWPSPSAT